MSQDTHPAGPGGVPLRILAGLLQGARPARPPGRGEEPEGEGQDPPPSVAAQLVQTVEVAASHSPPPVVDTGRREQCLPSAAATRSDCGTRRPPSGCRDRHSPIL